MKRFIFACAIFLAPASMTFGQETTPADTGAVQIPSQPGTATDTGTTSIPPSEQSPSDSAAIPPPGGTDTGTVVVPPVTPDTGTVVAPSDTSRPADTTAIPPAPPPQPREAEPVPSTPQPEATPAETPGEGEEVVGTPKPSNRFALGLVFNDEAPVAMRAWFNPKVGLDVGLGINLRQVVDERIIPQDPESTTNFLDLSFDLGLPVRVMRHERVDLIVRPGFAFRTRPEFTFSIEDPTVRAVETTLELEMNGSIGFEYYPFEKASFGLFAGIALVQTRPGGVGSTSIRVESLPKKAANFAFRYYLF